MKINILKDTLLIFLGSTVAFLFVPLFMVGSSPEEYSFLDWEIFYKTSIFFIIIVGTFFSLVNTILQVLKLDNISTLLIYFVLSWITISGFIFSVSSSSGMIDPRVNPLDLVHIVIVLLVSVLFSIISITAFKKYIQIFLSIVVLTSTLPSLISIYSSNSIKVATDNHPSLQLSNNKNIFVISFDGIPGKTVSDIIKNNKNYSSELKDFIIFENAVSQAPATEASLIGDIYGTQDYKAIGGSMKTVKAALLKEDLSLEITSKHIDDSFQYGYPGYEISKMEINSPIVSEFKKFDTVHFFAYPIIRIWTSYGLRVLNIKEYLFNFAKNIAFTQSKYDLLNQLQEHKGPTWAKGNVMGLSMFDSFVSNISTSDKNTSLRYLHLTFTHFPILLDETCKYRANDKVWFDNNQNENGIKNNSVCGVNKFIDFLHKLKKLGIYDKSLIIFKSDHGKPTQYYSKPPYNLMINGQKNWGYGRYRPTLMIKDYETNYLNPVFKSKLVLLNDIAKTICEKSGVDTDCQIFNGVNLLGDSLINDEPYFIYVVKDAKGSFEYDTHISVKIPSRKNTLIQEMKESDLISLSE